MRGAAAGACAGRHPDDRPDEVVLGGERRRLDAGPPRTAPPSAASRGIGGGPRTGAGTPRRAVST